MNVGQSLLSKNIKLSMVLAITFLLAISIVYFTNEWYLSNYDRVKKIMNTMKDTTDNNEKKIFLVGNSRLGVINSEFITNYISNMGNQINIQGVAIQGAQPEDQLKLLKIIVSTNTEMVLIGVDIVDLIQHKDHVFLVDQNIPSPENKLFDPKQFFNNNIVLDNFFGFDTYNLKNPKLTSLMMIDLLLPKNDKTEKIPWDRTRVLNHTEMFEHVNSKGHHFSGGLKIADNPAMFAIEKIINVLSENEIKTVVIIMPRPQEFIDTISKKDLENYFLLIDKIQNTTPARVYSLFDKYAELEIFLDDSHVASTPEGLIYSEDVAKIILKEIET